jgi:hypothetical protein
MRSDFKKFRISKGYISHWFFGIRAVLIHHMMKTVFGYDDNFLMAGCAISFGYAVRNQGKANEKLETDEEEEDDEDIEVDPVTGAPAEEDDTGAAGAAAANLDEDSGPPSPMDTFRVLHNLIRAATELVRNDSVVDRRYGNHLRNLQDDMEAQPRRNTTDE